MKVERLYLVLAGAAFVCAVLWLGSGSTTADPREMPAFARVAVVDMSEVFDSYEHSKDAQQRLRKRQEEIKGKLKLMRDKIEALNAELANFDPNSKDYLTRQDELTKLSVEFEVTRRVEVKKASREMRTNYENIYKEMITAIESIGEELGYDLVLYRDELMIRAQDELSVVRDKILQRKVLYANPRIDLTDQVIRHLNGAYKLKQAEGSR